MAYKNVLLIVLIAISLMLIATSCPAPGNRGDTGGTDTGTSASPDDGTATNPVDAGTSADTAAAGDTGTGETPEGTTEGTAGTDTGTGTDGETGTSDTSADSGGEGAGGTADSGAGTEKPVDGGGDTNTDAKNPFPPDGTMWSYDDLGKNQNEKVRIMCETDKGIILFEVYPELAPNSVKAFLSLVNAGYYTGTYFHRIEKDFVAQAGCPLNSIELKQYTYNTDNWPAKVKDKIAGQKAIGVIKDEPNYANNDPGTLALAKIGRDKDTYDKDSAQTEFFINLKYNENLDKYFTVFGKVVSGMDVVKKLTQDDVIRSMSEVH